MNLADIEAGQTYSGNSYEKMTLTLFFHFVFEGNSCQTFSIYCTIGNSFFFPQQNSYHHCLLF